MVMKVRRPECEEQPSTPRSLNIATNQFTMLLAFIRPPRAETITGDLSP